MEDLYGLKPYVLLCECAQVCISLSVHAHSYESEHMDCLQAPRFDSGCVFSQDPALSYIWSEKSLNDDQRRAIIKVLLCFSC